MAHRPRTIAARLKSKGRLWMFLPVSVGSKNGHNSRDCTEDSYQTDTQDVIGYDFHKLVRCEEVPCRPDGFRRRHGVCLNIGVYRHEEIGEKGQDKKDNSEIASSP